MEELCFLSQGKIGAACRFWWVQHFWLPLKTNAHLTVSLGLIYRSRRLCRQPLRSSPTFSDLNLAHSRGSVWRLIREQRGSGTRASPSAVPFLLIIYYSLSSGSQLRSNKVFKWHTPSSVLLSKLPGSVGAPPGACQLELHQTQQEKDAGVCSHLLSIFLYSGVLKEIMRTS